MNKLNYAVISSGSKANSYIFESNNSLYVIDNGFSLKEFKKRVIALGFDYNNIKGIFVTHSHSDHLKGVSKLSLDLKIPVYAHSEIKGNFYKHMKIEPDKRYEIDKLDIVTFKLSHDSKNPKEIPLSYSIKIDNQRFTLITDTGVITSEIYNLCKNSDILFIESNYNTDLLENGTYNDFLQDRIKWTHLSNTQTIDFLNDLSKEKDCNISDVYLIHISENNNSVEAINKDFKNYYHGSFNHIICNNGESVKGGK